MVNLICVHGSNTYVCMYVRMYVLLQSLVCGHCVGSMEVNRPYLYEQMKEIRYNQS